MQDLPQILPLHLQTGGLAILDTTSSNRLKCRPYSQLTVLDQAQRTLREEGKTGKVLGLFTWKLNPLQVP